MEEQAQALKAEAPVRREVCFPTGYGKSLCYPLLLFVIDYKLGTSKEPCASVLYLYP